MCLQIVPARGSLAQGGGDSNVTQYVPMVLGLKQLLSNFLQMGRDDHKVSSREAQQYVAISIPGRRKGKDGENL